MPTQSTAAVNTDITEIPDDDNYKIDAPPDI